MQTKYVAIAPKVGKINAYLTNGKEYPVLTIKKAFSKGKKFTIETDYAGVCTCLEFACAHLNGLDWTIKKVKP